MFHLYNIFHGSFCAVINPINLHGCEKREGIGIEGLIGSINRRKRFSIAENVEVGENRLFMRWKIASTVQL